MTTDAKKALRQSCSARRGEAFRSVDQPPAIEALKGVLLDATGPISFYWPIRTEIDPRPAMEWAAQTNDVCLPLTHGRDAGLTFLRWTPGCAMTTDGFGVGVPDGSDALVPRTLVIPMLGFDARGHRLGYGAGHYDRTLEGLRGNGPVLAIGFAFGAQEVAQLPIEPTDQSLDVIVTENGVRRFP
ncbi:MAG: 5-formyltetrahydrofolate cyclo-ligase [Pseudomonadota bacterium]